MIHREHDTGSEHNGNRERDQSIGRREMKGTKPSSTKPASEEVSRDRVALFLPTLDGGGAERAFVNLAGGMAAAGKDTDLVVGNARGIYRSEVPATVNLVDLEINRLALAVPRLIGYLRRRRPSRLYSALEEANIVALVAKRLSGVPCMVFPSIRNSLSAEEATAGDRKTRIMRRLARMLYPNADGIVAVSAGVAEDAALTLGLRRDSISVIANPTLTEALPRLAAAPLDHPWFEPGQPPVILSCGRLSAQKDYATLIQAFSALREHQLARLVILGEGECRGALEALSADMGFAQDIAFPGFEANPFRFMSRSAVFALSSVHEGSPNVLVQALACGLPIVATDCPSGPSEILEGVETARLVPMRAPI